MKITSPRARKWQLQVGKGCLAGLLGDEEAVAPLLNFSKETGIEATKDKEMELKRKNDQEDENLPE